MRFVILLAAVSLLGSLAGCGGETVQPGDFGSRLLVLPGGQKIRCEESIRGADQIKGLMFREKLDPDRGMIFLHKPAGRYSYWMYQVKIPLDIIWIDEKGYIVEIVPNAPPCPAGTKATECPQFGGNHVSQVVLELAGGMAAKYGLTVGTKLAI